MADENFSEEQKVRLTPTQLAALEKLAVRRQSKPATLGRIAIHEMLLREDEIYRAANSPDERSASDKVVTFYADDSIEAGSASGVSADNPPSTIKIPADFPHPVDFVIQVRGDSMLGIADDGDLAAFTKIAPGKVKDGDVVAVVVNGLRMLKMAERANGEKMLTSTNPKYDPIPWTEDTKIQGFFRGKIPIQ